MPSLALLDLDLLSLDRVIVLPLAGVLLLSDDEDEIVLVADDFDVFDLDDDASCTLCRTSGGITWTGSLSLSSSVLKLSELKVSKSPVAWLVGVC